MSFKHTTSIGITFLLRLVLLLLLLFISQPPVSSQDMVMAEVSDSLVVGSTWAQVYNDGVAYAIKPTFDGGYIVASTVRTVGFGVYKLDTLGNVLWHKTYQITLNGNFPTSIIPTNDGGYVVAGYVYYGPGGNSAVLLKLDSVGNVMWQRLYGGPGYYDQANSVVQTPDEGYIVAGFTESYGAGGSDAWLVKFDSSGNIIWQKTYGESSSDWINSISPTSDGNYIVAGTTNSFGAGGNDVWILKIDGSGNVLWQKTYGESSSDRILGTGSIAPTSDGGYIVAGTTNSFGAGGHDAWVFKLDSVGNIVWQKLYGGFADESVYSMTPTSDGGYVVVGQTRSFGDGNGDAWVFKLDSLGNILWQKSYRGIFQDGAHAVASTDDGGYIVAGSISISNNPPSFTLRTWVLKVDGNGNIGNSCSVVRSSTATTANTNAVITNSSMVVGTSSSVPINSTATPNTVTPDITRQCVPDPEPTPEPTPEPALPIVFLPGILGTRLVTNGSEVEAWPGVEVWLSDRSFAVQGLVLKEDGSDLDDPKLFAKDIIREEQGEDVYAGTIEILRSHGYNEGQNLWVFPYDFRKDNLATAISLEQKLDEILVAQSAPKVNLIVHSQGGYVAKQCILTPSCAQKLNSVAIIATPLAGLPYATATLEYGTNFPGDWSPLRVLLFGIPPRFTKSMTQNWPSMYQGIPSENYFDLVGGGYFTLNRDINGDGQVEGTLSYEQTKELLKSRGRNAGLIDRSENFYRSGIDEWQETNGVMVTVFAGTGLDTITEITEEESGWGIFKHTVHDFDSSTSGDGLVPFVSPSLRNIDLGVDFSPTITVFYVDGIKHGDLAKHEPLLQYIAAIFASESGGSLASLASTSAATTDNMFTLLELPSGISTEPTFVNGRQFLVIGAVELEIIDQNGNRTGIDANDTIELNATDTSYTEVGETKAIFVRGSEIYTVNIKANEPGVFDLRLRTVQESEVERFVHFADVPLSSGNSTARFSYNADAEQPENLLEVDQDGDGVYETTIHPTSDIDGELVHDNIPPSTSIHVSGIQVGENQYLGPVEVTLDAIDDPEGSGLAKVEYTIDGGITVHQYEEPFTIATSGVTTVEVRSIDNAGNTEATISVEVQIVSNQPPDCSITSVLDNFNRSNGALGGNWTGLTTSRFYRIINNTLDVEVGGPIVWKSTKFGTTQAAFVTLTTVDKHSPSQGVLLKVQAGRFPNSGAIAVVYDGLARVVRLSTWRLKGFAWTPYASTRVTFANGDKLGACAKADGTVDIFKNDILLTTVTLNAVDQEFFNTKGGKIGLWSVVARKAFFDDFGGSPLNSISLANPTAEESGRNDAVLINALYLPSVNK